MASPIKILSVALVLLKFWQNRKLYKQKVDTYNAQVDEWNKQMDIYYQREEQQLNNSQKEEPRPEFDSQKDIVFKYQLFVEDWGGYECQVRLLLTITNKSDHKWNISKLEYQPYVLSQLSPFYARSKKQITLKPHTSITVDEWEWHGVSDGKTEDWMQKEGKFTPEQIVLATGRTWDEFQNIMREYECETRDGWYCLHKKDQFYGHLACLMDLYNESGRMIENGYSFANDIDGLYYYD